MTQSEWMQHGLSLGLVAGKHETVAQYVERVQRVSRGEVERKPEGRNDG